MTETWREELLAASGEWQADGLCREVGGELFFPGKGDMVAVHAAKQLCGLCPVAVECREYAISAREPWGIWGGLSERDRRLLRAKRRRQAKTAEAQKGAA